MDSRKSFCMSTSGRVPLDPRLSTCSEGGESFVEAFHDTPASKMMADIVQKLLLSCSKSVNSGNSVTMSRITDHNT